MTVYISRDYSPATSGYATSKLYTPVFYQMGVFLRKVLGFSVVGATGWNLDFPVTTLVVSNATNASPIQITTTTPHGFTTQQQSVVISGVTGNTAANGTWVAVVTGANTFTLLGSAANANYISGGSVSAGFLYTSGLVSDGYGTGINFGAGVEKEIAIPISKRTVVAGDVGKMIVMKSNSFPTKNSGCFKISAVNLGNTTTIAAGSNGQTLPQATINVASAAAFPTSGTIFVNTSTGTSTVTYTNKTGTSFTGCTGGTGTMSTGGVVSNLNRYVLDYRSTENPPVEAVNTIDWWLYEVETTVSNHISTFNYSNSVTITGGTTTIAAGSNGAVLPQATINVVSTAAFTTSGQIYVTSSAGVQIISYTGTNATQFTGCTGGTGTLSTGGAVGQVQSPIVITTGTHGFSTGQKITVSGVSGNTNANGTWIITVLSATTFSLNGSSSNGITTGGSVYIEGYQGDGASYNSRIILQSPHATGWQVRLAVEPQIANLPIFTVAMGLAGNTLGDFPPGSSQNHLPEFFDLNVVRNSNYNGLVVGGGRFDTASRTTIVADGYCQNVFVYTRSTGATANGMFNFGFPDNEPAGPPPTEERLYSYGPSNNIGGTQDFGAIVLRVGSGLNVGFGMRTSVPRWVLLTGWSNLDGTSATNPMLSANAGDSVFTASTELLPIEIWAGTNADLALATGAQPPFFYDQAFMGTAPRLRLGRTNFGAFTLTTEEVTSRTVTAATNASPIQITTSVANALVTGQTITISGVQGNTAANGTWTITVINNQNFTLNGSTGNGTYTSGGTVNGTPSWLHLQNGVYVRWDGTSGLTP